MSSKHNAAVIEDRKKIELERGKHKKPAEKKYVLLYEMSSL